MCELSIQITGAGGNILAEKSSDDFVNLVFNGEYHPGDSIALTAKPRSFLVIRLDDGMGPSFVYMKQAKYVFPIPFGEKRHPYSPKAFSGQIHLLKARMATDAEISSEKNLARNEYDCHGNACCFPHASANVETRGESVFATRNAIDGNTENHCHGNWPYESWGINCDPDAEIQIDFGRAVQIRKIALFTRADFPHDNWWTRAELSFSDGTSETVSMTKTDRPQTFSFSKDRITWVKLGRLIKSENDPSPFPALTQIQVFGTEASK